MKHYVDKDKLQEYTTKLSTKLKTIFATKSEVGVTPEMFGAIGDGVNDDTEAIQQAMNNGNIIRCSRIYKITQPIKVKSNSIIEINKIVYSGTNCALLFENVVNTSLRFNNINAPNGTGIRFCPDGKDINNSRIKVFEGSIWATNGIEMISDPETQIGAGGNVRGNQEISFYGLTIIAKEIGVLLGAVDWNTRRGWNGEINFFGGSIMRYSSSYYPIAIKNTGYNTGLFLSSVSLENVDVYYDMSGEIQKFYSINCRDERAYNPNNRPAGASTDANASLYPIKIHPNKLSKFYFISDKIQPYQFNIDDRTPNDTSKGRVYIVIEGISTQNGRTYSNDAMRYVTEIGWSMEPSVSPDYRYSNSITNGYIRRFPHNDGIYEELYFPVFGWKATTGSNPNVTIPNKDVNIIRARGLPIYLFIASGCTLTIGDDEDPTKNDVFTVSQNTYIMLVPQGTELTLGEKEIHNGLVPIVLTTL